MHPVIYQVFEEVCGSLSLGGPVLEVGAVPGSDSLLHLRALGSIKPRMGLNLEGNQTGQWPILQGNANDMNQFTDGQFRTVLCNAMLEHDRYFWKTIAEIDRVTASGGWIVIGVPGYRGMGLESYFPNRRSLFARFAAWFARGSVRDVFQAGAPTVGVHCYPGDYYRFSEQAVREVFMDGLESVSVRTVMNPPRFISWGKKP